MADFPYLQFYPADYMSDGNVQLCTTAQEGIYLRLLCFAWIEGSVPASIEQVQRICKRDARKADIQHVLTTFFVAGPDGRLINRRLEAEREKVRSKSQSRSLAGHKSAESRRQKANARRTHVEQMFEQTPEQMHEQLFPDCSNKSATCQNQNQNQKSPAAKSLVHPSAEPVEAEPGDWAAVAAGMASLRISRKQKFIDLAKQNRFTPELVLGLIAFLRTVPESGAEGCQSRAGALCDRLESEDGADWPADQNWPWQRGVSAPAETAATAEHRRRLAAEETAKRAARAARLEALATRHLSTLAAMDDAAIEELISTASPVQQKVLRTSYRAKGRDSPDVRPTLLELLDQREKRQAEGG